MQARSNREVVPAQPISHQSETFVQRCQSGADEGLALFVGSHKERTMNNVKTFVLMAGLPRLEAMAAGR